MIAARSWPRTATMNGKPNFSLVTPVEVAAVARIPRASTHRGRRPPARASIRRSAPCARPARPASSGCARIRASCSAVLACVDDARTSPRAGRVASANGRCAAARSATHGECSKIAAERCRELRGRHRIELHRVRSCGGIPRTDVSRSNAARYRCAGRSRRARAPARSRESAPARRCARAGRSGGVQADRQHLRRIESVRIAFA